MLLIILLAVLGAGLLWFAQHHLSGGASTFCSVVGYIALGLAALFLVLWIVDEVDDESTTDADLLIAGPLAWLATRRNPLKRSS